MFSLIASVGKNRELGKQGELLFRLKDDMRFFRETTDGHKILMGRKTWESLPKKLPGRENIVISRNPVEGADVSVNDLRKYIDENKGTKEEIFVIGGGMVYFELLPHAKHIYLTEVDAEAPDADTFFPQFDKSKYTREIIMKGKDHELEFTIVKYAVN